MLSKPALAASLMADIAYVGTKGTALTTFGPGNAVQPSLRPAPAANLDDERARLSEFLSAAARAKMAAAAKARWVKAKAAGI